MLSRVVFTLVLTWLYCGVWTWLEKTLEGQVINSKVDNIIMLLFVPIIYLATETIIKWFN